MRKSRFVVRGWTAATGLSRGRASSIILVEVLDGLAQAWLNGAMRAKLVSGVVTACLLAVVGTNGIASLPFANAYQVCVDGWFLDGQVWRADVQLSIQLLPYSLRCSYDNGLVETHGPELGTWLAVAVAVAMALMATTRFRGRAGVRGLVGGLVVLAACGYLAQWLGMELGVEVATLAGVPVVYGIDRGLRIRAARKLRSCLLAVVLPVIVLLTWGTAWAVEQPAVGVLIAVTLGSGIAALIERAERLDELLLQPPREGLAGPQ
jgi:hypothetical protein